MMRSVQLCAWNRVRFQVSTHTCFNFLAYAVYKWQGCRQDKMNDPHKYDINQQGISKQNPSLQMFLLLFVLLHVLLLLFVCVCMCFFLCVYGCVCGRGDDLFYPCDKACFEKASSFIT